MNYETEAVSEWIDADDATRSDWNLIALACWDDKGGQSGAARQRLAEVAEDTHDSLVKSRLSGRTVLTDLMHHALRQVDWVAIADAILSRAIVTGYEPLEVDDVEK